MKVSLGCNQDRYYIDKADEIYVPAKRMDLIEEIHTQYPNKFILLDNIYNDISINDIKMYSGLCRGMLKVLVGIDEYESEPLIQRVLFYPITSIIEMYTAYSHGIREFYIGPEMLHQLNKVKQFKDRNKVTIRITANVSGVPCGIGISAVGGYLLPQELDLDLVKETIDIIDFEVKDAAQEAAYYRIYFENNEWQGSINDLILDFDSTPDVTTRMIEPLGARFRCNLSCLFDNRCHLCWRNIDMAKESLYKNILDKAQE